MTEEHPTLQGLPQPRFGTSPSRLDTWLGCPRRYRYQVLERTGLPQKRWARTMMGSVAHLALRSWWADELTRIDSAIEVVDRNWEPSLFRDPQQSTDARERVRAWVRGYLDKHAGDASTEVRGVERTISTMTEHLNISGRIDRIDERGGRFVVIDYKTNRGELSEEDARVSRTLAIYADSVRRSLRQPCHDVELHHLPTGTIARHTHTDESLARHLGRADEIGLEIRDATRALEQGGDADRLFPATPGPLCGWCDYRSLCPTGAAATPERDPWVGVDEDSSGGFDEAM
jgi:RecB family exonuclease